MAAIIAKTAAVPVPGGEPGQADRGLKAGAGSMDDADMRKTMSLLLLAALAAAPAVQADGVLDGTAYGNTSFNNPYAKGGPYDPHRFDGAEGQSQPNLPANLERLRGLAAAQAAQGTTVARRQNRAPSSGFAQRLSSLSSLNQRMAGDAGCPLPQHAAGAGMTGSRMPGAGVASTASGTMASTAAVTACH